MPDVRRFRRLNAYEVLLFCPLSESCTLELNVATLDLNIITLHSKYALWNSSLALWNSMLRLWGLEHSKCSSSGDLLFYSNVFGAE